LRRRRLALVFALATVGCEGSTDPGPRVVLEGRLERGQTVEVRWVEGEFSGGVLQAFVSFIPADAASASLAGNGFVLHKAGPVTVVVNGNGGSTLTGSFEIAAPPSIVFDMVVEGNRDVYRAAIDGQDVQRLTTDAAVDADPTAAKGSLVFTSYRNGNAELYSRTFASASEARLTTTATNETGAVLSPDGTRLAYTRDDNSGTPRVFVATNTNGSPAALTANFVGGSVENSPSWRFASDSLVLMSTATGKAALFVSGAIPGSTALKAKEATFDTAFVEPSWSTDGKLVAFTAGIGNQSRIMFLDRGTGMTTALTPTSLSAGQPTFLADGRIVFTVFMTATESRLAWIDPAKPGVIHDVVLSGTGTGALHPSSIWP
jgi:hypothetical protein